MNDLRMNKKDKGIYYAAVAGVFILTFSGCANLKEAGKGILGISTKEIEQARPEAIKKVFNYEYDLCYNKTLETLNKMGAYIYAKDKAKKMLGIYISPQDTTVAGIFFKEISVNSTQIEVASPSTYAKELIAHRLFLGLEKTDETKKEEPTKGGPDALRQQP